MDNIMQQIRAIYAWEYENNALDNRLMQAMDIVDEADDRLSECEDALEEYEENVPLLDRITGRYRRRIAELEAAVQEAQENYDRCEKPYKQLQEKQEWMEKNRPAGDLDELTARAAQDPANRQELAALEVRFLAGFADYDLAELHAALVALQKKVAQMERTRTTADREAIALYKEVMDNAKKQIKWVENYKDAMDRAGYPCRIPDFFRNPDAMSPASSASIGKAADEVREILNDMLRMEKMLAARYPV